MKKKTIKSYDKETLQPTDIEFSEDDIWSVLTNDKIIHSLAISLILIVVTLCWSTLFSKESNIPFQTNNNQVKVGEYNGK